MRRRASRTLQRIQYAVINGEYDLTRHAVDEMAEDRLGILDVESAILSGEITKTETGDPRGPRYIVVGLAEDQKRERCTGTSVSIATALCGSRW